MLKGKRLEIADMHLDVTDIDEASSALQKLHLADQDHNSALVQHIAPLSVLELDEGLQFSMNNLYDDILNHWVKPLPSHTSNRVRQRKERLARRIAAEVMMA